MFNKFEFSGFKPKTDLALYANVILFQITDYIAEQFTSLGTLAKMGGKYACFLKYACQRKHSLRKLLPKTLRQLLMVLIKKCRNGFLVTI